LLPDQQSAKCLKVDFRAWEIRVAQRQLGRSSIELTVDTCGRWLSFGDKNLVDRLDAASGSKTVAGCEESPDEIRAVSIFRR